MPGILTMGTCVEMVTAYLPAGALAGFVGKDIVLRSRSSSDACTLSVKDGHFVRSEGEVESPDLTIIADPRTLLYDVRPLLTKNPIRVLPKALALLLKGEVKIRGSIRNLLKFRKVLNAGRAKSREKLSELLY